MRKILGIAFLGLTLSSGFVWADESSQADVNEALRKIESMKSLLKISGSGRDHCVTPSSVACSFQSYCGKLGERSQEMYLYKDSQGKKIANFNYLNTLSSVENCIQKKFPEPLVQDPFLFPELLSEEDNNLSAADRKKMLTLYKNELKRAEGLFSEAKSHIVKMLEGRRSSKNAKEINQMIAQVRAVKMKSIPVPIEWEELAVHGCEAPNAYYSPGENTVTLCPQILNYPDGGLYSVIAHELGHAIDSCNVANHPQQGKEIYPDNNPLKGVLSCLQSPQSLGVKIPSKSALEKRVKDERDALIEEMKEMGDAENGEENFTDGTEAMFADRLSELNEFYDSQKHCASFIGNGHMQEAFSDWVATQAVSERLKGMKEAVKAKDFAFTAQSIFLGTDCENIRQVTMDRVKAAAGKACAALEDYESYMQEAKAEAEADGSYSSHPEARDRVNKIMMADPKMREALGCKGDGSHGQNCT